MKELKNLYKSIYSIWFISFVLFLALFLNLPIETLPGDDFVHLTRAKWSIFGERKVTYTQRDKPLNYSWLYHYILRILGCKCNLIACSDPLSETSQKVNSRCYKVHSILRSFLLANLLVSILILLSNPTKDIVLALPVVFISSTLNTVRIVTYIIVAVTIVLLRRWERITPKRFIVLFVFSVIWVNVHITAPLYFLTVFLFMKGNLTNRILVVGLLLPTLLINPFGHRYIGAIWEGVNILQKGKQEVPAELKTSFERFYESLVYSFQKKTIFISYFDALFLVLMHLYLVFPFRLASFLPIISFLFLPFRFFSLVAIYSLSSIKTYKKNFIPAMVCSILILIVVPFNTYRNVNIDKKTKNFFYSILSKCELSIFMPLSGMNMVNFLHFPKITSLFDSFDLWTNKKIKIYTYNLISQYDCIILDKNLIKYKEQISDRLSSENLILYNDSFFVFKVK